jgi:long-subunit acyl-CoA synthetase (AMP-forming)
MPGKVWSSDIPLPEYSTNLAAMLNENGARFGAKPVYQEVRDGEYAPLSWRQFLSDIIAIQGWLAAAGLEPGDRVAILSRNCQVMLEMEMAVMASGAVAVPIFAGYPPENADTLTRFCEPQMVVVADQTQYDKLQDPARFKQIIHFAPIADPRSENLVPFSTLLEHPAESSRVRGESIPAHQVCLMMYTSGTMGKPKCVQLTHRNILSQQAAMRTLWQLSDRDRFLSYLPWHHSFGGIFEKYAALTNGAVLSLEHGFGKDIDLLIDNWRKVLPTVFFSVPRIYQELVTRAMQDPEIDRLLFHPELRFIFTAAAPLPQNISDLFIRRGIPVVEGWGLTETSPCCTVTDPDEPRESGVVGKPIPGVSLKIAEDGEILVRGPNVMTGYFKNPEATRQVFTEDRWFKTGDVGEFTPAGLRLISRKDRIFKLSNAEKVVPTEIENLVTSDCAYLAHAYVAGSGQDHPVALLFPNKSMFSQLPDESRLKTDCQHPRTQADLARCLRTCLRRLNAIMSPGYYRLDSVMLVDRELSIENEELTPSMKLAPNVVGKVFKAHISALYGDPREQFEEKVYVIRLQ